MRGIQHLSEERCNVLTIHQCRGIKYLGVWLVSSIWYWTDSVFESNRPLSWYSISAPKLSVERLACCHVVIMLSTALSEMGNDCWDKSPGSARLNRPSALAPPRPLFPTRRHQDTNPHSQHARFLLLLWSEERTRFREFELESSGGGIVRPPRAPAEQRAVGGGGWGAGWVICVANHCKVKA